MRISRKRRMKIPRGQEGAHCMRYTAERGSAAAVRVRCLRCAMTRPVQPNPRRSTMNSLPESAHFCMRESERYAQRAMYPQSSSIPRRKKRMNSTGKKDAAAPTPGIIPSQTRSTVNTPVPPPKAARISSERAANNAARSDFARSPRRKVSANTADIIRMKNILPSTGWQSTRSARSVRAFALSSPDRH